MSRILVCGDAMLDTYLYGEASALSQEAPVPIVKLLRKEHRAGAAANVAMNCKAMGADVELRSVGKPDAAGEMLRDVLRESDVPFSFHMCDVPTIEKQRLIAKQQQVARIDIESVPTAALPHGVIATALFGADVLICSDYAKGAIPERFFMQLLTAIAHSTGVKAAVLVDPKGYDWTKYRGVDLIKPNVDEMRAMVGGWTTEDDLTAKAVRLLTDGAFRAILLTRAAAGMSLYMADGVHHIKSEAREVFDVCGAGDTAIAAFAVALTMGMDYVRCAHYANRAAGVVVGKFGTAVATKGEVFGTD